MTAYSGWNMTEKQSVLMTLYRQQFHFLKASFIVHVPVVIMSYFLSGLLQMRDFLSHLINSSLGEALFD